jgi:hypothetical protein
MVMFRPDGGHAFVPSSFTPEMDVINAAAYSLFDQALGWKNSRGAPCLFHILSMNTSLHAAAVAQKIWALLSRE